MGLMFRKRSPVGPSASNGTDAGIRFLSDLQRAVRAFDDSLGFDLESVAVPPRRLDDDTESARHVAHIVVRRHPIFRERVYALYTRLTGSTLTGHIARYHGGSLTTLRDLGPVTAFPEPALAAQAWLTDLIRASCDKI